MDRTVTPSDIKDPSLYQTKYIYSLISNRRTFSILRQVITKSSVVQLAKQGSCQVLPEGTALSIKFEDGTEKQFQFDTFESIELGSFAEIKFIDIKLKNDKQPLILLAPVDIMELWYDGLRMRLEQASQEGQITPETKSSQKLLEMFTKACQLAKFSVVPTDDLPPPPTDMNFATPPPTDVNARKGK